MNVIFFGDSICNSERVSPHQAWVTKLSASVEEEFGDRFVVVNASVNGNTTRMALERMHHDVQSRQPVLMVLQFGINDSNYWESDLGVPRVSPEAFKSNLMEIITRAFTFGAQKVLVNTNHPTNISRMMPVNGNTHQQGNLEYNHLIKELADELSSVTLVDMEDSFVKALGCGVDIDTLLMDDGVHLTLAGNDLYRDAMQPVLFSALREIDKKMKDSIPSGKMTAEQHSFRSTR